MLYLSHQAHPPWEVSVKAYRLKSASGSFSFQRTQAEAKRIAKLEGLEMEPVDIPTAQQELIYFLNDLAAEQRSLGRLVGLKEAPSPDELKAAEQLRSSYPASTVAQIRDFTADEIQDFILNRATVAQTENIFACLGTRFAETLPRKPRAEKVSA
jgi:hypothetical protein